MTTREIKFRLWDVHYKEMKIVPFVELNMDMTSEVECGNMVVMQYTGLKDKNGVEIYEGDVLKTFDESILVVKFGDHETGTDYYSDTAYGWFSEDRLGNTYSLEFYSELVIGNIYENPELLKEIKL